eukprot:PITA_35478
MKLLHFDGEQEEAAEAWLINMNKYFQLYEYDHNLKAMLAIFELQGKVTLWWEEFKMVKGVSGHTITWEKLHKYFKERYLTKHFYDEKARELHDLRLGQQTMDEFIICFTSLLHHVPYIQEEKAKVQRFVSSLPLIMRERIDFDNPRTMDDAIRNVRISYHQRKQKGEILGKRWVDKKSNKLAGATKGNRGSGNKGFTKGQNNRSIQKNSLQLKPPSESKTDEQPRKMDNEGTARPPMQCWGYGPSLLKINAALEDRQVVYQSTMVEFEGQSVTANLNVLPLGSYDVLIGIDWLEKHWSIINCKTKTISYKVELGIKQEMQGIKQPVQIQPITASQLTKCIRKRCQIYAVQVGYANSKDKTAAVENIPVIHKFADVFPEEIRGLLLKGDIGFTIELVPGVAPISQAPYKMIILELTELKMQLQELLDKNYIRPSVSPWGAPCCSLRRKTGPFTCI